MTRKSVATAMPWVLFLGVALTSAEGEPSARHRRQIAALKELAGQEQFVTSVGDEVVFPQVANGVDEGVGITTAIFLTNPGEEELVATLRFRRADGLGMVVDLYKLGTEELLGSGDSISVAIPASQSVFLETGGSGSLTAGWASVSAPSGKRIGGGAVYSLFDPDSRRVIAVVGVGPSPATPAFSLPVLKDDTTRTSTAVALANSSGGTARLKAQLLDSEGDRNSSMTLTLGPGQQLSRYVHELFSEVGSRFYGTLHVRRVDDEGEPVETLDVHPLAILQKGHLFSSMPVTRVPVTTPIDVPGTDPALRVRAQIWVSPTSIERGRRATLTWASANAESAEITPEIGVVPLSGSRSVSPSGTTTYRITVRGAGGQAATDTATLTVTEPAGQACADGSVIRPGGQCDLKNAEDETVGTFTVAASGASCLRMEEVILCAARSHDIEDATLNEYRVTLVASREENGYWTISRISISSE